MVTERSGIGSAYAAELPGEWRNLIVYVGETPWDGNQFVSQHVAGRLAERSPVLYVDPPISRLSARRRPELAGSLETPRLRSIGERIARLTPIVPPGLSRPVLRDVAIVAMRRSIRRAVTMLGSDPVAMIAETVWPVLGAVEVERNVYYATDDFAAGAELMGLDDGWVRRQVRRQLAEADIVLTVSEHFARSCRTKGIDTTFVPNGCDVEFFANVDSAPLPDDVDLPRPIAGFVGHLSHRMDLDYLEALADTGVSVLLVGPRQFTFDPERMGPLIARDNVQWVGSKPFAELPSYLRVVDVGIVPYGDTEFNRASFPLKLLEYLAAGRPVVSTDLPAVRWLDTDLITVGRSPAQFAAAVGRQLATDSGPDAQEARRSFARRHSWERRVEQIATLIGLPT